MAEGGHWGFLKSGLKNELYKNSYGSFWLQSKFILLGPPLVLFYLKTAKTNIKLPPPLGLSKLYRAVLLVS